MAKLSNSPKQALNFDLERRKSFTFRVRLKYSDGSLVNLTGCTLRFVMKSAGAVDDHFDLNNLVVNSEATIGAPLTGEGVFAFQAAELDGDPGEYGYSIVLWSPDNFSTVLAKGVINLLDNSESHSMHRLYSATAPTSALELTLRGGDVVEVEVVSLPQVPVTVDAISWPDVGGKPESFPPSTHGHTINEVTGLATELAGKQPAGSYAPASHSHTIANVTGLQGALDGKSPTTHNHDGTYAPATHGHTIANVTGLQGALDGKAASSHSHTIANVTGLQGALDGKQPAGSYAASSHSHTSSNITDFTEATQDIVGAMVTGAGGTYNDAAGTITLPSGGGGGGAVSSVAGRTGAVVLSSADLTDAASLATDAELTAGLAGKANTSHTHTIANVTGLQTALDGKQPAGSYAASAHTHAPADITGTAVITTDPRLSDARTPTAHTHTIADTTGLQAALDGKAATGHTHAAGDITSGTLAAARLPAASATASGIVELATTAEATTGTDTTRAVTPAGLKAVADAKANSTHTHTPAQIGTGTPAAGTYVDGATGAWTPLPSGGGGGIDTEAVQDIVGTMVTGAGGTYDDAAGTITLPSGGGGSSAPMQGGPISGSWLMPSGSYTGNSSTELNGHTCITPYPVERAVTINKLATRVNSTAAGATAVLALYNSTAAGLPGTRIAMTGTLDASAAASITGDITPVTLTPGLYWIAVYGTSGAIFVGENHQTSSFRVSTGYYHAGADPWQYNQLQLGYSASGAPPATWPATPGKSTRGTAYAFVVAQ